MANPEHVELVKKGAEALNTWRAKHLDVKLYLKGANLRDANLKGTNLQSANLLGANLSGVSFEGANLVGANLQSTNLWGANFGSANLSGVNLGGANLRGTNLRGANLTNSIAWSTVFANCDLRGITGLELIRHQGPSTIGMDTIMRSEGDIPHVFLKGCGVPDHVIDFVDVIARKPIQYYSCFISHGEPDKEIARHLFDKLQGVGVRCWFFNESARTGESVWGEINKAIRLYEKLIIICSRDSLQREGVLREICEGFQREKEEKLRHLKDEELVANGKLDLYEYLERKYHTRVLFPITIDNYIYDEWPSSLKTDITNRVIGDFRNWEDFKSFDKAFQKLLKDLNSSD